MMTTDQRQALQLHLVAVLALLLTSCTSIDLETSYQFDEAIHQQIQDQTSDSFPELDTLYLSEDIKQMIDAHVHPRDDARTRVSKLQELLYGEQFLNIQYNNERTLTAIETFEAREGNCLSVMNLYIAMARHAGVDASFQTVEVRPKWDRKGTLLVLNKHINATGKLSFNNHYVVDLTPEIQLQQLTSSVISDRQARALYFNNLGGEALIDNDLELAVRYLKNALFLDPELSIAWNNIGIAYIRSGHDLLAEFSFQRAFQANPEAATPVSNLARYYRGKGNLRLARRYEEAISDFRLRNPYYHHARGVDELQKGNLEIAHRSLLQAVNLRPYEPDFYLSLAEVYGAMGEMQRAQQVREAAQSLLAELDTVYTPSNQTLRFYNSNSIRRGFGPGVNIVFD